MRSLTVSCGRLLALALALLLATCPVRAQVSAGGTPPSFDRSLGGAVPTVELPTPDVARLLAEDEAEVAAGEDKPFRFGSPVAVDLGLDNAGLWSTLPDGGRVWRLRISSPGAYSLNVLYDLFKLPAGAQLFLYNEDQSQVIGAFTEYNSACSPDGTFATQPVAGDAIVLEYYEPHFAAFHGQIHLNSVVHAYRNFFGFVDAERNYGDSGSCNNNVNCPEGAAWQSDKRAVAMILTSGGSRICTGAMVNNTALDMRQYFLTANHCGLSTGSYIFMFNYESPTCANANGPTTQTAQGCTLRANNSASDFTLVEITEAIPSSYNIYFAGWSNVNTPASSSTCIHHPSGDIKKITFSTTPTTNDTWSGTPANSHWRANWSDGVTEPGSSGSPLFDQNHRIIGQLHGGPSSCSNPTYDVYGKFSLSWAYGGTAATRLYDWLNPANNVTTLDGMNAAAPTVPNLALGSVVVNDGNNGALDPGESPTLVITLSNTGAAATGVTGTLSESSAYVTVTDAAGGWPDIAMGGSQACNNTFALSVAPGTPAGTVVNFSLVVNAAGGYTTTKTFSLTVSQLVEGFESGNFATWPWSQGGTAPWTIVSNVRYAGNYAAKSGTITANQTSTMTLSLTVSAAGTMGFMYKVSSEANYDFLTFYIDGVQTGQWSGEIDWTAASVNVTAGAHTFAWTYSKDGSVNSGSDCAWVDQILLPPIAPPAYPEITVSPASLSKTLAPGGTGTETLTISNSGQAALTWSASAATATMTSSLPFLKLAKGEDDPRVGEAERNAGGPDSYGYRWKDSNEAGGPVYSWVDISGTGTNVAWAAGNSDDGLSAALPLGFTFNFYGTAFTTVKVCSNGYLSFTTTSATFSNQGIPNTSEPNNLIAPFWDDLNATSAAMVKSYADAANQRFIVSWLAIPRYNTTTYETFQAILYADGRIVFQYNTMAGTLTSASVGIENAGGTVGLQVVANAAYITNSLAVQISAQQPWLSIAPTSGSVPIGGSGTITATFNATGLAIGTYTGTITIASNDPDEATTVVPVTLIVGNPDTQGPSISLSCLGDTYDDLPRAVTAAITDASGVQSASLLYSINGGAQQSAAMAPAGGNNWTGTLPGVAAPGTMAYQVSAVDASSNHNSSSSSPCQYNLLALVAPVLQIANPANGTVVLSWPAVPGATQYGVYQTTTLGGPYTLIATTAATNATLTADPDAVRIYRVTAQR